MKTLKPFTILKGYDFNDNLVVKRTQSGHDLSEDKVLELSEQYTTVKRIRIEHSFFVNEEARDISEDTIDAATYALQQFKEVEDKMNVTNVDFGEDARGPVADDTDEPQVSHVKSMEEVADLFGPLETKDAGNDDSEKDSLDFWRGAGGHGNPTPGKRAPEQPQYIDFYNELAAGKAIVFSRHQVVRRNDVFVVEEIMAKDKIRTDGDPVAVYLNPTDAVKKAMKL